ncbi:MAG: MOSC domain-containing protein [Methylobacteriaceae bacterium]|nr:MOSC domain-containing protein [Methylobacteriaceae bacterium]
MLVSARVAALWRYPVKGLSAEPLDAVELTAGDFFPGDRLFAIENGPTHFDPAAPVWMPKIRFLMLMRDESLARLATRYDEATTTLTVVEDGREVARGDLSSVEGRAAIAGYFAGFIGAAMRGPADVLTAPAGFRFTDSRKGFVSILNRASLEELGARIGRTLDPLRFRANILVERLPPWGEFDLVGREIVVGGARLAVTDRIRRCAATNVEPRSGRRDLQIPAALERLYGHMDCGVYARVVEAGRIAPGDALDERAPRLV